MLITARITHAKMTGIPYKVNVPPMSFLQKVSYLLILLSVLTLMGAVVSYNVGYLKLALFFHADTAIFNVAGAFVLLVDTYRTFQSCQPTERLVHRTADASDFVGAMLYIFIVVSMFCRLVELHRGLSRIMSEFN